MLAGLDLIAGTLRTDLVRMRARSTTAAACYGIAAVVFLGALGLGGAAVTVMLVERFGLVEGLAIAALVLVLVGVAALLVNAWSRMRWRRRARRLAAARTAAISQVADDGVRRTRDAVPSLLPVAAVLSFALTTMFMKK